MNPICKLATNLSEFIARQVPCQSDSFLKHEANVKTLWLDIRKMVFPMQSTLPSAAPQLLSQCDNPDQLKTERLENNLRPCGKCWLNSLKILFLDEDDEGVFILPALDVRSQILSIKDRRNGIGKLVFKLAPLGSGQTCLFLVFRLKCYNGFFLMPTGLTCDGRPLASPLLRRLAGRGAFFFVISCFDGFYAWRLF